LPEGGAVADFEDARRIALTLPETTAEGTQIGVRRGSKIRGMAWLWNERVHPKKPRVPNPEVLAIRTASNEEKEALLASDPEKFFTEPHYNGFPAVLVRLAVIEDVELRELLIDAWRCQAPPALVRESGL
jgi:hypothetical protein